MFKLDLIDPKASVEHRSDNAAVTQCQTSEHAIDFAAALWAFAIMDHK